MALSSGDNSLCTIESWYFPTATAVSVADLIVFCQGVTRRGVEGREQTRAGMARTENSRKVTGYSSYLAGNSQVNIMSGYVAACMYDAVIAVVDSGVDL
jgi:hypothetical protein